jgi:hypothetical protein
MCLHHAAHSQPLISSIIVGLVLSSDCFTSFKRMVPIPTVLRAEESYKLDIDALKSEVKDKGLSVVIASNPRNP